MNMLLRVVQILLALWNAVGGAYMVTHYEERATPSALNALPRPAWVALGALQVLLAVGLVVPRTSGVSAIGLVVLALLGLVLYTAYAGFPGLLWAVIPAALAAFVAYERLR